MTAHEKINAAMKMLASAQAELAGETRETRETGERNLERVAEFLRAETVAGDKVSAKLCWQRFEKWLPGKEWQEWNNRAFYARLRRLGYRVAPGTNNKGMIHGLTLRGDNDVS